MGLLKTEKITLEEWLGRIAKAQPGSDPMDSAQILDLMFPGFSLTEVSSHYQHRRSIAEEAHFGRYLLLALPEDDVSDELIAEVIDDLVERSGSTRIDEFIALLDGADDIANLAISRAFQHRREATASSRALVDFLFDRVESRASGATGPGSPQTAIGPWLAREIALTIEAGQIEATDVISTIGEADTFFLVMQFKNVLRDRERAKPLTQGFADYWLAAISSRTDELLNEPQLLANAIELIAYAHGVDRVRGIFDPIVVDFASYMRIATAFVRFSRWVRSDVTYEMRFEQAAFEAVITAETRARFADEVLAAKTGVAYDTDELSNPAVGDDVLREFVLDSLSVRGE